MNRSSELHRSGVNDWPILCTARSVSDGTESTVIAPMLICTRTLGVAGAAAMISQKLLLGGRADELDSCS